MISNQTNAALWSALSPTHFDFFNRPFVDSVAGETIAWSRVLDEEEALRIVNGHGRAARGADVVWMRV